MNRNRWIAASLWIFSTLSFAVWIRLSAGGDYTGLLHFSVLMGVWLALSDRGILERLHSWTPPESMATGAFLFVLLLYHWAVAWAKSQLDLNLLLGTFIYYLLPFLLVLMSRSQYRSLGQFGAAVAIWIPVELSWLSQVELAPGFPITMTELLVFVFAFYLFIVAFPVERIGYTYDIRRPDWSFTIQYFSLFTVFLAIPLALMLDFAAASTIIPGFAEWPFRFLAIFFFIALPEEFLFRGIFQNLLEKVWPLKPLRTLLFASVLFGFSHANNANPPYFHLAAGVFEIQLPWAYILLATLAGIFYGLTYRRTEKITAAAIVHTLVDFYWSIFFSGGVG